MDKQRTTKRKKEIIISTIIVVFLMGVFLAGIISAVDPIPPDSTAINSNETKSTPSSQKVNISGGRILNFNITSNTQNPRWKAFVGQVIGSFTLDDQGGSTIFDWTLTTLTGRIYATRTSGAVSWSNINCSNRTYTEAENSNMAHNNTGDNITATFDDTTHQAFYVGSVSISANSCPTLNTYINNVSNESAGQPFEEMVLYDTSNTVFATIIEEDETGYDGVNYDFQMIVPENGSPTWNSSTAYYLYVEIGT